jgi:IS6 family transposase
VTVAGRWTYLYRAVDQHGQVIDVLVSRRRDAAAARSFFARALQQGPAPVEVVTDRAPAYSQIVDEMAPAARHITERYTNNPIEADHGRFKARLRPMRGLKRLASARTVAAGHAFVQNLRRGHYAISADLPVQDRIRVRSTTLLHPSDRGELAGKSGAGSLRLQQRNTARASAAIAWAVRSGRASCTSARRAGCGERLSQGGSGWGRRSHDAVLV